MHVTAHDSINNPCRGSSIGRACGSYNSKEINLKVEGSSPSFGYSYNKVPSGSCSFAFFVVGFRAPKTSCHVFSAFTDQPMMRPFSMNEQNHYK
jgi:hypothetical protein